MSQAMTRANQVSSGYKKYLLGLYYLATAKLSLSFAVFGLLIVATGPVIGTFAPESYNYGVHPANAFAAIAGVVGASFFVFGVTIYLVLLINRKVGEATG